MADITGKPMGVIVNWFTLMIVCVFDPLAIAMVLAVNKYLGNGRREEEDDYYTTRNKMLHEHTLMNGDKQRKKKEKLNQEALIKKNEEILATKKVSDVWEVEDTEGNVEVYPQKEERMDKEEFLEKLTEVEDQVKKQSEPIYLSLIHI